MTRIIVYIVLQYSKSTEKMTTVIIGIKSWIKKCHLGYLLYKLLYVWALDYLYV